jgi:hypothetical protein
MFSTVFWVCFRVGHVSSRGGRCNSVFGRFFSGRFFSGFVFGRCRRRGHCLQYINNTVPFADIFCRAVFQFQLFRRFFRGSGFRTSIFQSGSVFFVFSVVLWISVRLVFSCDQFSCKGQRRIDRLCVRQHYLSQITRMKSQRRKRPTSVTPKRNGQNYFLKSVTNLLRTPRGDPPPPVSCLILHI